MNDLNSLIQKRDALDAEYEMFFFKTIEEEQNCADKINALNEQIRNHPDYISFEAQIEQRSHIW